MSETTKDLIDNTKAAKMLIYHYQQRKQDVEEFYHKVKYDPVLGIFLKGEAKLPYNIKYHNDDKAFIELAVAGYKPVDVKADLKGNTLSIYTAYDGTLGDKESQSYVEYDYNTFLDDTNVASGVNKELYIYKGLTSKPFHIRFNIPENHTLFYAENKNGILTLGFTVNHEPVNSLHIPIEIS